MQKESFKNGDRPHVTGVFGHRKRRFSNTLSTPGWRLWKMETYHIRYVWMQFFLKKYGENNLRFQNTRQTISGLKRFENKTEAMILNLLE